MNRSIFPSRKAAFLLAVLLGIVLQAFSAGAETTAVKDKKEICREAKAAAVHIEPSALHERIAAAEEFVLLDIRTRAEYEAGHIEGAVWLPRGILEFAIENLVADPETEIVVYCLKGCRGSLAVLALEAMGYRRVSDLAGGLARWVAQGLPLRNQYGGITVVDFLDRDPYVPVHD